MFDPEVFAAGKTCSGFPGPGLKDHTYTFNPMAEFVHGRSSHVDEAFNEFTIADGQIDAAHLKSLMVAKKEGEE